ncbi:hypothetical protein WR25_07852 [Diploscapter pachys]|uniref:RING-type domain-containing protein n=1 Tax=Diploscapter pachys TaxID=2018661 RepID=A0A2A2KVH1_9BILA|nr:hypothetical protein WR25_07852 [Diploscapter pachys]
MPRPENIEAKLEGHLYCPLCQGSFEEPYTSICCMKTYCRECYFTRMQKESRCPGCEKAVIQKEDPRLSDGIHFDFPKLERDTLYDELSDIIKPERKFIQRKRGKRGRKPRSLNSASYTEFKREAIHRGEFYYGPDDVVSFCLEHDQNLPSDNEGDGTEPAAKRIKVEDKDKPSTSIAVNDDDKTDLKWMTEPFSLRRFRRFLRCPAKATIGHLKTLLRTKLSVSEACGFVFKYRYYHGPLTDETSLRSLLNQQPAHARLRCLRIFFKVSLARQRETPPSLDKEAMPSLEAQCEPDKEVAPELISLDKSLISGPSSKATVFITPPVQSTPFNGGCPQGAPRKRTIPKTSPEVTPPNSAVVNKPQQIQQPSGQMNTPRIPMNAQQGAVLQHLPYTLMCRGEIPAASMQLLQQLSPEQQSDLLRNAVSVQQQQNLFAQGMKPPRIQTTAAMTPALQAQLMQSNKMQPPKLPAQQTTSTSSNASKPAPTALEMLQAEGQRTAHTASKGLQLPTTPSQSVKQNIVINGAQKPQNETPKQANPMQQTYMMPPQIMQRLIQQAPPGTVIHQKPGQPPSLRLPNGQILTPHPIPMNHPAAMMQLQAAQQASGANVQANRPKLLPQAGQNGALNPAQGGSPNPSLKLPVATIPRSSTQVAATIMTLPLPTNPTSSTSPILVQKVAPTGTAQKEYNKVVQPQNGQSVHTVQPLIMGATIRSPASNQGGQQQQIMVKSNPNQPTGLSGNPHQPKPNGTVTINGDHPNSYPKAVSATPPPRLTASSSVLTAPSEKRAGSVQPHPVSSPLNGQNPGSTMKSLETPSKEVNGQSGSSSPEKPLSSPTVDDSMDILTLSQTQRLPLGKALRDSLKASKNHGINVLEGVKTSKVDGDTVMLSMTPEQLDLFTVNPIRT